MAEMNKSRAFKVVRSYKTSDIGIQRLLFITRACYKQIRVKTLRIVVYKPLYSNVIFLPDSNSYKLRTVGA